MHEINPRPGINTRNLLTTREQHDWQLDGLSLNAEYPAVQASPHPDFIGSGDYATAGWTHAIAAALPIAPTMNHFITRRLLLNQTTND